MKACVVLILAANALLLLTESKSIGPPNKAKRAKRSSWSDPFVADKRDELFNALNGLERARRRFESGRGNQYLNPMAYLFDGTLTAVDDENDGDNGPSFYREGEEGPDGADGYSMRKKSEYTPYRTYPRPADMAELENILASPAKARAKRPVSDSSEESDTGSDEDDNEVNPVTRQQLEMLLRKAEEYEKNAVDEETAEEVEPPSTVEPVSSDEMESVLAGEDTGESSESKEPATEGEANSDEEGNESEVDNDYGKFPPKMPEINKEWLINQYLKAAGEEASKKHKRVARRPMDVMDDTPDEPDLTPEEAEEVAEEIEEEAAASEEAKYTKKDLENLVEEYAIENKLISKENEFLATALNAATLGQIERSDKYLGQQYQALQNAVKVEEALQNLKNGEDDEEDEPVDKRVVKKNDEEEEFEKLPEEMPEEAEEKGEWLDGPIPEGYEIPDEDSPEFTQLNPFLRKMIKIYGPEKAREILTKREDEDDVPSIPVEEEDVPSDAEIEEAIEQTVREKDEEEAAEQEAEENEIASTLERLISNMVPTQKRQLKEQIADIIGNPKDACPAVETLADGCENLMKQYAIDLDKEAQGVCTRHKVCYACGSSIDDRRLSRDNCDKLFLREAEQRCRGEESCKEGASGLFLLMDREHSYIDDPSETTSEICNKKCVARFILGLV